MNEFFAERLVEEGEISHTIEGAFNKFQAQDSQTQPDSRRKKSPKEKTL
jgi:hypothetical protein